MSDQRTFEGQRRSINIVFTLFAGFIALMWGATVLDAAFGLGWDLDRAGLWLLPAMMGFAVLVRLVAMAIITFFGSNYR